MSQCPMSRINFRMGRLMVPRVKDNNPIGTQKTVSLDFDEE